NNALAGNSIAITPGADLIVTAVSGPAKAVTGGSIRITNTIENVGMADIVSTFNVGIYISTDPSITLTDRLVAARNVPGLAQGHSNTDMTMVGLLPRDIIPGTYYLGVIADRLGVVTEATKTNNARASDPIQITLGPDLLITSLSGPSIGYNG